MPPEQQELAQDQLRSPTGEIKDQAAKPGTEPSATEKKAETTPETKSTEPAKAADGTSLLNQSGEKTESPAGAPEKYEPFKAPEGFTITEDVNILFKELNLSQAASQKLIDFVAPQILEALEAPFNHYNETRQGWQKETMDKYGTKLPEVKQTVSKALDSLGNPKLAQSFREAMDLTGAGDNPAFIDVLFELAKKVTEGSHVKGSGPSKFGQSSGNKPASAAQAMYPHLPSAG